MLAIFALSLQSNSQSLFWCKGISSLNMLKTILVAMQETNDALYTLKSANSKHSISQDRLDLSKKEMSLTEERKKIGTADRLNLLKRKQSFLATKKQEVSLKINSEIAMIGLYQALGGVDYTENL